MAQATPAPLRFWAKVDKRGPDECWEWQGARKTRGYGDFNGGRINGRSVTWVAHRWAYTTEVGPIPPGIEVCHRCDNPPCVNPAHLFLGTHQDNMADGKAKGRLYSPTREQRTKKLSPQHVEEIRALYTGAWGQQTALAARYGVTQCVISTLVVDIPKRWTKRIAKR